jgi:antitoxin (DNA-binding transcriptional repressor) of toxin-antitoxin stability system
MAQFNLAEAKARLSELVQKAMLGEEVIVAKEKKAVVRVAPIKPAKRKPGTGKGIWIFPDFDGPVEDLGGYMSPGRLAGKPKPTGSRTSARRDN